MKSAKKIIIALDVDNISKAKYFIDKLSPQVETFKVGLQLFTLAGPEVIRYIQKKGRKVFLDLKFFDIPNTVALAVRQAVRLKVSMLTLHISAGPDVLRAAVKAARQESRLSKAQRPLLLGVTILTSQEANPLQVLKLAQKGISCGLDGVVCSAREAQILRKRIKKPFIIVTPGIRAAGSEASDQKRTATAKEALRAGSNFLVVGRPILQAPDPLRAVKDFL